MLSNLSRPFRYAPEVDFLHRCLSRLGMLEFDGCTFNYTFLQIGMLSLYLGREISVKPTIRETSRVNILMINHYHSIEDVEQSHLSLS